MASMGSQNDHVPISTSSSLLSPLGLHPRRSSVASAASQMDNETMAQALDQIHSSASRSDSLTTFNDFAPPPLSSSEKDERSSANQAPMSSLGNIYTRLKASVAGPKDSSLPVPPKSKTAESSGEVSAKQPDQKPAPMIVMKDTDRIPSPSEEVTTISTPKSPRSSGAVADMDGSMHVSSSRTTKQGVTYLEASPSPGTVSVSSAVAHETSVLHERRSSKQSNDQPALKRLKPLPPQTSSAEEGQAMRASVDAMNQPRRYLSGDRPDLSSQVAEDSRSKSRISSSSVDSAPSAPSYQQSISDRTQLHATTPARTPTAEISRFEPETSVSAPSNEPGSRSGSPSAKPKPINQLLHSNSLVYQVQRKVLNRDFWMKDENAKVCFNCGESFSTFRRKHHCRLCGQIFCNSCTNLISGKPFSHASKLRVCRTCEGMLNDNDSSDYSEDEEPITAPPARQIRFSDTIKGGSSSPAISNREKRLDDDRSSNPVGGSLSSRRSRELRRTLTSGIEPSRQPALARPSSSRSLKSLSGRPRSSSHKPHRPRNQHMRSLSFMSIEAPPFHKALNGSEKVDRSLPAFHTDSIIDPDLAPFMSDEGSSEDDFSSISVALESESHEHSSVGFNGNLVAPRRGRPRTPGKNLLENSLAERDADNVSVTTSRTGAQRRHLGNRALSVGSFANYGSSPHVVRSDNLLRSSDNLYTMLNRLNAPENESVFKAEAFTPWDVSANRYNSKGCVAELNPASLDHMKKLLCQFLCDANIHHTKRWERALIPILLRCAAEVDPSIHRDDDIDIRHYIKLKKAPGGNPSDSKYVSGIVFSKNVALKDMPRTIHNPKILLVAFPLIYARHQQHFMSLEGVIAQEREYLKNLSNRIIALRPNLLLVQGQVAGLVTGFLQDAGITVVYNVKSSVMHAASRCTQTKIVSSVDKLTMDPRGLGFCGRFDVKTHVYQQSKISHVYLSGCQEDLGCTIVLRGADPKTLSKLKWITEFMCYVAYNLKLETCLMRDQFISLPASREYSSSTGGGDGHKAGQKGAVNNLQGDDPSKDGDQSQNDQIGDQHIEASMAEQSYGRADGPSDEGKPNAFDSYDSTVRQLKQRLLSVSPFVKLAEPYLLLRGQEQELHMARLRSLQKSQDLMISNGPGDDEKSDSQKFELVRPEMIYAAEQNTSRHVREILYAVHNAEYEKALHNYKAIQRRWEMYIAGVVEPYSPFSHQKIVALFSIVSTLSADSCVGPDLLGLDFYQEHDIEEGCERDMPLGEYVERLCDQVDSPCITGNCERKMVDHHRQYVHGDGQLSVFVEKHPSRYRNMENTILMWSCCRICEQETQVVPMSRDTWKYSFAKYLELSFWSSLLHPRAGTCLHDIHRDHVRYFGFKSLAIRIQYDSINIVEVIVPRGTITWAVDKDLRLKNTQYQKIEERVGLFLSSVKMRLRNIKLSSIDAEKRDACKTAIEDLVKRANDQYEELTAHLQQLYMSSKFYEIIPLNKALQHLQEEVAEWDTTFANFERSYFPSEKDLRKLAATQLRKAYLDQDDSLSVNIDDEGMLNEKSEEGGDTRNVEIYKTRDCSAELQDDHVNTALREEDEPQGGGVLDGSENSGLLTNATSSLSPEKAQIVQNLDLAIPAEASSDGPVSNKVQSMQDVARLKLNTGSTSTIQDVSSLNPEKYGAVERTSAQSHIVDAPQQPDRSFNATVASDLYPSRLKIVPLLIRAKTQPNTTTKLLSGDMGPPVEDANGQTRTEPSITQPSQSSKIPLARSSRVSERTSASALKIGKTAVQSLIPRAISGRRNETRVSALAKHFEEMSRQFEKERLRERLLRAARTRQARAYPLASAKPVLEVFRDANEAVGEREPSYEELGETAAHVTSEDTLSRDLLKIKENDKLVDNAKAYEENGRIDYEGSPAEQSEENTMVASYPASEVEGTLSDTEASLATHGSLLGEGVDGPVNFSTEVPEYQLEIAKDEKSSLMKMITSFWSERSASGWSALEYPILAATHMFADSDLIVREDEPSSLIAFTLASEDYQSKIQRFWERAKAAEKDKSLPKTETPTGREDIDVERIMLGTTATHMRYQFQSGTARMQCKVFYAESFDAIRRKCGVSERFVESLSTCLKWDSKGGKTKSLFLKTLDERFVLKSLSAVETQAFLKFAPDYFDYMSKCLFHNLPSALAKMLGFYQVVIKNPATGNEFNWFLQVMENVFYEGPSNRMFDLKGSMRNRKVQSTGDKDEVLLDENLLDYISQSPVYVRNHSNTVLASSIQNDTLFCSKQNVMDYSLIVGLYDDRKELLVGIIDYIRTYTWDKKLESWIKDRGKHKATVRSPKEYRTRFRRSIPRYFPLAPSCWQVFGVRRIEDARARVEEMDAEDSDGGDGDEGPVSKPVSAELT